MAILNENELKSGKGRALYWVIFVLLTIGALIQFFPLCWMALGTFKTNQELVSAIPSLFPAHWSVEAYVEAFTTYDIWNNVLNTAILCVSIILLQVGNSALSAYALSKMRPRFGQAIFMGFLATMMFSGTALIFPLYIMMSSLGLIGSKWALILSSSAWAYSIVLFKSFFDSIPGDLMESARIDGAGNMRIFLQIILPLSKPIIAVNVMNTFIAVYNDFLYPLMLLPNQKDWTIMIRIYMLDKMGSATPRVMYVMLVTAVLPVIVAYLFAQRNIAEGISTTGIKG